MNARSFVCLVAIPLLVSVPGPVRASDYGEGMGEMTGTARLIEALRKLDGPPEEPKPSAKGFTIREFRIEGSTLYTPEVLNATLRQFRGSAKTVEDVEEARGYLQKEFERVGYPTMVVTIPEQTIRDGIIRFRIIEAKVDQVEVTGNRHYSDERILGYFPDLEMGEPLYAPGLSKALDRVNENPDHQVSPVLKPGAKPGTTRLELKVKDKSPWHGRMELNNNGSLNTPDLRSTARLAYDNLWGLEHKVSITVQTTPQRTDDVKVIGGSYAIPIRRWNHLLTLYGSYSDSTAGFTLAGITENLRVANIGKDTVLGARYSFPIFSIARWHQNLSAGIEYKRAERFLVRPDQPTLEAIFDTPVRYLPFNVGYEGYETDAQGFTRAWARLNVNFAGTLPKDNFTIDFRNRSVAGATGDWAYVVLGFARQQRLWREWTLRAVVDGQIAGQPLIDTEQFGLGGATSVRGFLDRVVVGDNGLHASGELRTPDLGKRLPTREKLSVQGLAFLDYGKVATILANRQTFGTTTLASAGIGMRVELWNKSRWNKLFASLDYAIPFQGQDDFKGQDQDGLRPVNFSLSGEF